MPPTASEPPASQAAAPSTVLGIFVGGRGRRMGGRDKAALPAPDGRGSLVQRAAALGATLGFDVVLLGARRTVPDPDPQLRRLLDDPDDVGPLGGLGPALRYAGARPLIALACDMPFVTGELLSRLAAPPAPAPHPTRVGGQPSRAPHRTGTRVPSTVTARSSSVPPSPVATSRHQAAVWAPRVPGSDKWMPLCARYCPAAVLPALEATLAAGERSFQQLFARVTVTEFPLLPGELQALRDWDRPEDMRR